MLLGGLDRESAVQALSDPEVELARVAPLRQRFGDGFTLRRQMGDGVGDQVNQPLQGGSAPVGRGTVSVNSLPLSSCPVGSCRRSSWGSA